MQMKQLIELYVEATLNQTHSFPIDSRDCGNLRFNFPFPGNTALCNRRSCCPFKRRTRSGWHNASGIECGQRWWTHPRVGRLHVLLVDRVLRPLVQHLKQVHPLARLQVRLRRKEACKKLCKSSKMHLDSVDRLLDLAGNFRDLGNQAFTRSWGGGTCRHCIQWRGGRGEVHLSAGIKLCITSWANTALWK